MFVLNDGNDWNIMFDDMPRFDEDGNEIIENAEKILYLESILDDKTGTVLEMLGVAKSLESTKNNWLCMC